MAAGTSTVTVKLQESDTLGSGYADITGGTFTAYAPAAGLHAEAITFTRTKEFIRAVETVAGGATDGFTASVTIGQ